jgi:hypothetical protein
VTAASAPAGQGTASVVSNQVQFNPGTDFDDLAVGQTERSWSATRSRTSSALLVLDLTITVTGTNDGPVANPDTATTSENAAILVTCCANDTDADNGAVLTLTAASAPAGQGTAHRGRQPGPVRPGQRFRRPRGRPGRNGRGQLFDRGRTWGFGPRRRSAITVTGTNDGPVAHPDARTTSENGALLVDVLANDTDADNGALLTLTAASAPAGQGTASVVGSQVQFDPGADFDALSRRPERSGRRQLFDRGRTRCSVLVDARDHRSPAPTTARSPVPTPLRPASTPL